MKIVHVLPALTKGGGERVVVELANHAARAGHEVSIIAAFPVDSALLPNVLHPDVRVRYVSDLVDSRVGKYLCVLPWLWRYRLWLAEQDILHCHLTYGSMFGSVVGTWRSASGTRRPMVVETYHAVGVPIHPLHRWLHARLASRRDALVFMAKDDYWSAFLLDRPDLHSEFIPNGISISSHENVDRSKRRVYRQELGIPDDCRFVVGTVGRMRPERQPWLYMPIFAEIARTFGPEVHFVIAGGGSELDRMRSLVNEHGLEGRVHLPGLILRPDLPLSIMDLYITLNVGAITGIAALEAALSGLPVLAIQLLAGYESGPNDWIWSSADLMELAEQAIKLLHSPTDRQALAERQSAYVRAHHTTEVMANSYYELYNATIERSRLKSNTSDRLL